MLLAVLMIKYTDSNHISYELLSNFTAEVDNNAPNAQLLPENLVIPETVTYEEEDYTVKSISMNAFFEIGRIKSISLRSSIEIIKMSVFDRMMIPQENLTIPTGVRIIEHYAFATNLFKNVFVQKTVESFGFSPFGNNLNLTVIEVDEDNKYYSTDPQHILYDKKQTVVIQIPSVAEVLSIQASVTAFEHKSFDKSVTLRYIFIRGEIKSANSYAFNNLHSLDTIYYFGKRDLNRSDIFFGTIPKKIVCCAGYKSTQFGGIDVVKYGPCFSKVMSCRNKMRPVYSFVNFSCTLIISS